MLMSSIREQAARLLTRGKIDGVAAEVYQALADPDSTDSAARAEEIAAYAIATVPFYRQFAGLGLADLPVVSKATMQPRVDDFLAAGRDKRRLPSTLTSGSTGIPFRAYRDAEKLLRHRGGLVGTDRSIGVNPYGPTVHARGWGSLSFGQRQWLALKGQLPYRGEREPAVIRRVARWLTQRPGASILGYSSYVEDLFRGFEREGLSFRPGTVRSVVCSSEPQTPYLDASARRLFGLPAHMRYANMEQGIMAVTGDSIDEYRVDTSSFHIEILKENGDSPAEPGEVGRIVVTDLFNRAMPFIRYDTGDLARFALDAAGRPRRHLLVGLAGRRADVLIAGTPKSPTRASWMVIPDKVLVTAGSIRQFQLRQKAIGEFTWVLNAERSESMEKALCGVLDEHIGNIRECRFIYTHDIPTMASGKRKIFVQEIPDAAALLARMEEDPVGGTGGAE